MAWAPVKDWGVGEVVTAAKLNQFIRDNLRYLKGTDGLVDVEAAIAMSNIAVNMPAPTTRAYVRDNSDVYAGVIENLKTGGSPNGLLLTSNINAANVEVLSVNRGVSGSATSLLSVRSTGAAYALGAPIFHGMGWAIGGAVGLAAGSSPSTIVTLNVSEPGQYWVQAGLRFDIISGTTELTAQITLDGSPALDASSIAQSICQFRTPVTNPTFWYTTISQNMTVPAGTHTIGVIAYGNAGSSGGSSAQADLFARWISP